MTPLTPTQEYELEGLIDQTSLWDVLNAIEKIAYEKAEHVANNWHDLALAQAWAKAAQQVAKAQGTAFKL